MEVLYINKINLGILFGGNSSEYEVSLMSAFSVLSNIDTSKYHIHKIGITKQGKMFYYQGDNSSIKTDDWWKSDCEDCVISPDRIHHGLILLQNQYKIVKLDIAFPILHGKNGEDGTVQGLLTMAGIPFVGCDILSSACCMDKDMTHIILDKNGVKTSDYMSLLFCDYDKNKDNAVKDIYSNIGLPCFIKPANAGSSVGVSKVSCKNDIEQALNIAFVHDKKVIIEKMVVGIEIECAVFGNTEVKASVLGEIESCNDFYDYDAKYIAQKTNTYIPARIDKDISEKIQNIAIKAYKSMGCNGFARVDFFLTNNNDIILNEINTIPGFTSISMYPQLMIKSGISYKELIDRLISLGLERV